MSTRAAAMHQNAWRGVFLITGGGSGFLAELLSEPGASRTVLDAQVPYAAAALSELLGGDPEQACSEFTARALAMTAFQRARKLSHATAAGKQADPDHLFGFACTASLASDRPKRGQHRTHAAVQTATSTYTFSWTFSGARADEELQLVEHLWTSLLSTLPAAGVAPPPGGAIERIDAPDHWQALILGETRAHPTQSHDGKLLFPGAFNPLHDGHTAMLAIAERLTGLPGAFELSVANVDKPFLDYREIETRLAQFDRPAWLTRLPTFVEKAQHFPGGHFVIGLDTLLRIVEPRYYGNRPALEAALGEIESHDTRFVVFGRYIEGRFLELADIEAHLPEQIISRCIGVSRADFHNPISSSEIRQQRD